MSDWERWVVSPAITQVPLGPLRPARVTGDCLELIPGEQPAPAQQSPLPTASSGMVSRLPEVFGVTRLVPATLHPCATAPTVLVTALPQLPRPAFPSPQPGSPRSLGDPKAMEIPALFPAGISSLQRSEHGTGCACPASLASSHPNPHIPGIPRAVSSSAPPQHRQEEEEEG